MAATGMVKSQNLSADLVTIEADIPLSELFGYIGHLRSVDEIFYGAFALCAGGCFGSLVT